MALHIHTIYIYLYICSLFFLILIYPSLDQAVISWVRICFAKYMIKSHITHTHTYNTNESGESTQQKTLIITIIYLSFVCAVFL